MPNIKNNNNYYHSNSQQQQQPMQWNNFACTSPPQSKTIFQDSAVNPQHTKSKSKSQKQLTRSSHKFRPLKPESPGAHHLDNSISALFVREMREEEAKSNILKVMCDALLEVRDIQKQQLEIQRRAVKAMQDSNNDRKKDKSTVKKKKSYNLNLGPGWGIEKHMSSKLKQFDRLKNDITQLLRKSRSSQKTHKKSQSIIKILR